MVDLSKLFKNAVINLYKSNVYTVDYAIIEASKLADKNKINAKDYEELMAYLAKEQEKSMQVEETAEKTVEEIENTAEEPAEEKQIETAKEEE
jgi:lipoate-protein ligase A